MMKRGEDSFRMLGDHRVISHLVHAKKLVPFQTFTSGTGDDHSKFNAQFLSGIGFGTNAFLHCHTDSDFTMSILQVFLKGKHKYSVDDDELYISAFQQLVLLYCYVLEIIYCSMHVYLIAFLHDANTRIRL